MWRTVLRVAGILLGGAVLLAALAAGTTFRIESGDDINDLIDHDMAFGWVLALAIVLVTIPPPGRGTWQRYAVSLVVAVMVGSALTSTLMRVHLESYMGKLMRLGAGNP